LQARAKPLFENETAANQRLNIEPFLASGTAVAFRKSLVQKIGKFDPDYFAYLEDIDFFLRGRLAGSIGTLCPGAIVYHRGAATELGDQPGPKRMESSRRVYLIARNRWHLIWDNLPAGVIILLCPLIFFGWLRGLGYHLFKSGQAGSFLAGSFNGFFSLPSRLSKRSAAKKIRRLKTIDLLSWMKKGFRELP
jgi:GT2 family glycosyltransferase